MVQRFKILHFFLVSCDQWDMILLGGRALVMGRIIATYMCQQTSQALVQIMACRLVEIKPLPERSLTCCQLVPHKLQ